MSERHEAHDPTAILAPGTRISHFEIVREIGRGGMGVVYHARDVDLGRDVALKHPWPELAENPIIRKRFEREARAASRLLHPHVVPVLEVFEERERSWLVMELVEGRSLRQLLRQQGALPVRDALRHADGLADALRLAHSKNILHRDINPKNILIDDQGYARLTDFGLVRFMPSEGDSTAATQTTTLTGEGVILGTLAYMSPEQALGRPTDQRSDLFSLGAVLYEMCTGEMPFPSGSHGDLLDAILHREPAAIARLNYEVPEELERIIRKCMRKRPDERYQSASELQADLRTLGRKLDSTEIEDALVRKQTRRPWIVAAAALAGATALALWWFFAPDEQPPVLPFDKARQITAAPGWEAEPALSRNGDFVAYVSDESGSPDIWLIDARGGNALQLTDDVAADRSPAWLPDGSAVLFASNRGEGAGIWKVPRLGGSATLVIPDGVDPAVSPDGSRIAFATDSPSGADRIAVAPLRAPEQARVLTADDRTVWSHQNPAWSPDGRTICYSDGRDLWTVSVGSGERRQLTRNGLGDVEPVWSSDGRSVYFSSARGGGFALWRVPEKGGPPVQLTMGSGPERRPTVSADGSVLGYSTLVEDPDLIVVNLKTGERNRLAALGFEINADLSPNGRALVFVSNRWGKVALWVQQLENGRPAGPPRQLTDHPGTAANPTFSPDGRHVAYHRVIDGQRDIWTIPSEGGQPTRVTHDPANDIQPAWSPNGSLLAYSSDREGEAQLWVKSVDDPAQAPRRVAGGSYAVQAPAWSPDGAHLAFIGLREDESEAYVVALSGDDARAVTRGAKAHRVGWESNGMLMVSGWWGEERMTLRRVPSAGGAGQPLDPPVEFGPMARFGDFDVMPDGSMFVFTREEIRGDLWVVESTPGSF